MAAAAILITAFASGSDAPAEPIKVSIPVMNATFAHLFIAEDKGYFRDEGLEVELVAVSGGVATPALISGSIQYSSSPSAALSAILRGAPLKVVLIAQRRPTQQLMSFDPKVKSFLDLKGQQIAVASRGATEEIAIRMYLKTHNLPPDYIGFSAMGVGSARVAALISGAHRHAMLGRIEQAELRAHGVLDKAHVVVDFPNEVELVNGGLATTEQELSGNRERTKRVLRAVIKGMRYMQANPAPTIDIMQRRFPKLARDGLADDVQVTITELNKEGTLPPDAATRELAVRGELLSLPPDKVLGYDKVFDFTVLGEVDRDLAAARWTPSP